MSAELETVDEGILGGIERRPAAFSIKIGHDPRSRLTCLHLNKQAPRWSRAHLRCHDRSCQEGAAGKRDRLAVVALAAIPLNSVLRP